MPDTGFDAHKELARIYTLQELMTECRARTPKIIALADEMLDDPDLSPDLKLRVMEFVVNRGFGKPRQHVVINDPSQQQSERTINPVKIYLPDNKRQAMPDGPIIDMDGQEQVNA